MLQLPTSPSASSGKTKTRYPYSRRLPLPSTLRGHSNDACGQTYSSHLINWQTILWLHIIHYAGLISYKLAINSATVSFTSLDYVWVEPCFVITVSNILTGAWATRFYKLWCWNSYNMCMYQQYYGFLRCVHAVSLVITEWYLLPIRQIRA